MVPGPAVRQNHRPHVLPIRVAAVGVSIAVMIPEIVLPVTAARPKTMFAALRSLKARAVLGPISVTRVTVSMAFAATNSAVERVWRVTELRREHQRAPVLRS